MSREGLLPRLQARGIQVTAMKGYQHSVSVYGGTFNNYVATIRVQGLAPGVDFAILERESRLQISLTHEHISGLYDCFWEHDGVSYFFVIVTEGYENDLAKEMKKRAETHFPWGEDELWNLAFDLVSALTYMQEKGISHRDINPENVLLTSKQAIKLVRVFLSDTRFASMTLTPFYSSPKLREAFVTRNPDLVHNSFKSDVFSLGLTLLSLSLLASPLSLAKANLSNDDVQAVICTVPYSDRFKALLSFMLVIDEDIRCDFQMLNVWIANEVSIQSQAPIKSAVLEQEQLSESSKRNSNSDTLCLQCEHTVNRDNKTSMCEVVQLYCEPSKHMFCSRQCFRKYLSLGSSKCPKCGVDIPGETVTFYKLQPIRAEHLGNSWSSEVTVIKEDKSSLITREFNTFGGLSSDQVVQMTTDHNNVLIRPKPWKKFPCVSTCCDETCCCW